jgi:2'-5' RNA ligase
MSETYRTFVAIELPPSVRRFVGEMQDRLRPALPGVRWIAADNVHLTLKFLGDVPRTRIDAIRDRVARAARDAAPFALQARGAGVFPGLHRPRVLWLGVIGQTDSLAVLAEKTDAALATLGFPKEKRSFRGHLTIGRFKGRVNPQQLREGIAALTEVASEAFPVRRVVVFRSVLKPTGAEYSPLAAVPVAAGRSKPPADTGDDRGD